jgi:hypothetical protein
MLEAYVPCIILQNDEQHNDSSPRPFKLHDYSITFSDAQIRRSAGGDFIHICKYKYIVSRVGRSANYLVILTCEEDVPLHSVSVQGTLFFHGNEIERFHFGCVICFVCIIEPI